MNLLFIGVPKTLKIMRVSYFMIFIDRSSNTCQTLKDKDFKDSLTIFELAVVVLG